VHFEAPLASEKKCGHMRGRMLVPASHFVRTLVAARLAADVAGVATGLEARTDAESARLLTSDVDDADRPFLTWRRTREGFFELGGNPLERCVTRALSYAPYADMLWMGTSTPNLAQARVRGAHPCALPKQIADLQLGEPAWPCSRGITTTPRLKLGAQREPPPAPRRRPR